MTLILRIRPQRRPPLLLDHSQVLTFRHAANGHPVLLADVFIDLDDSAIKAITASLLAPGDPELLTRLYIKEVGLKAAAVEALEGAAGVIDRPSAL
jgi:hypothetical protein